MFDVKVCVSQGPVALVLRSNGFQVDFETNALISPIFWGRLFFCLAAVDTIG